MRLMILGTGDHAIVVSHAAQAAGVQVVGHVGRHPGRVNPALHHEGDCADATALREAANRFRPDACALGFGDNLFRADVAAAALAADMELRSVIHPDAFVDPSAVIGRGSFVGPGAVVNVLARLGEGVLVNSGAIVEHDCFLADYSCLFSGAVLGGNVSVGCQAMIGMGASVLQGCRVGDGAVVGAGAVLLGTVGDCAVAVGVPAKVVRYRRLDEPFL